MPAKKGKKAAKHLHKGKKLEATKPLRKGEAPVEYLKVKMTDVLISS